MRKYEAHADFCGWHENQRDADCRCSASRADRVKAASDAAFGEVDPERERQAMELFNRRFGAPYALAFDKHHEAVLNRGLPKAPTQSRADSFMEAVCNTAIGFLVSLITWTIVARAMGIPMTWGDNLIITGIFTAVSIARGYLLRRAFNGRTVWATVKARLA